MKLNINMTREDYVEFNKFHFMRTRFKRTLIIGVVALIILQVNLNQEEFNWFSTVVSSAVGISIYVLLIRFSLNRTRNIPDKNGAILGPKEFDFTEDKITYKGSNAEGSYSWSAVKSLKESAKTFYLYMDTTMAIVVPKRVFSNEGEVNEFRELVKQKIGV